MKGRTAWEIDMTNPHEDDCVKSVVKYIHEEFNIYDDKWLLWLTNILYLDTIPPRVVLFCYLRKSFDVYQMAIA